MIERFMQAGFFDSRGRLVPSVIDSFILDNCIREEDYTTGWRKPYKAQASDIVVRHPIDVLFNSDDEFLIAGEKMPNPKRWEDLSTDAQRHYYLHCLRCEAVPFRPITFWIGADLIEQSKADGKPLAAWLLKRLSDRLRRLLGDTEFGLFFHLETTPGEPHKLHAHGIIYISDESWFRYRSAKYTKLRNVIRDVTGFEHGIEISDLYNVDELPPEDLLDHSPLLSLAPRRIALKGIAKERWLFTPHKPVNYGFINYSTKSARHQMFQFSSAGVPEPEIGERIEAASMKLRRRARDFYERIRPLMKAFQTGDILDWEDEDWKKVGGTAE